MFDAQALLSGDENALAGAVDALSPELYRYAAGILLNRHDAEDAVQCAFASLWQHRESVKNPDAVRAYLPVYLPGRGGYHPEKPSVYSRSQAGGKSAPVGGNVRRALEAVPG